MATLVTSANSVNSDRVNRINTWAGQIRSAVMQRSGLRNLSQWLCENTSYPGDKARSWTFKNHEYQIGIVNCQAHYMSVMKASQIGASELTIRLVLGYAALRQGQNVIYSLPTAMQAKRFAATRINPIIRSSGVLTSMSSELDNLEVKSVGESHLFIVGAQKDSQAISVPATAVINDELDFSDPEVIGVFESRLGHCAPGEDHRIKFSTPTVPGVFISSLYEAGTQNHYMCYHWGCNSWVDVLPERDIQVPGVDVRLGGMTARMLDEPGVDYREAVVICDNCGGAIEQENLANAEYRAWVEKYPAREEASFRVTPLDVAAINPASKIVRKLKSYPNHADYSNFTLGLPEAAADNSFLSSVIESCCRGVSVNADVGAAGTVAGLDVGVVSHFTVMKEVNGRPTVIYWERIRQGGENELFNVVMERIRQFGVVRLVVDAMPDISVPKQLIHANYMGKVLASYFITGEGSKDLKFFDVDESDGIVKVNRTRMFDELAKTVNGGDFVFPAEHPEKKLFLSHMGVLRRVARDGGQGRWESVGDDHYCFSLLYAYVAYRSLREGNVGVPAGLLSGGNKLISKFRLRVVK